MKKWYREPYFDKQIWILENFNKLNLSAEEAMIVLLIDYCKTNNKKITYDYLCEKMNIDAKKLDELLALLVSKHCLKIMADTNGIFFDIDGLFDFDEDKYEEVVNEDVYEIVSYFLSRPLIGDELIKTNELIEKYGENKFIDALRMAEAYRKHNLAYVEGILKNEEKQQPVNY